MLSTGMLQVSVFIKQFLLAYFATVVLVWWQGYFCHCIATRITLYWWDSQNIFFTQMFEIKPTGFHFSQKLCWSIAGVGLFLLF